MRRIWADNKRGAALVEFAIVAMLLFTLLFGIIEFGLLIKDYLTLNQAAREGARSAALRAGELAVDERVRGSAAGFDEEQRADIQVDLSHRVYDPDTGVWTEWSEGPPPSTGEIQVRVKATYPHQLIAGSFFGLGDTVTVSGDMVMRRE